VTSVHIDTEATVVQLDDDDSDVVHAELVWHDSDPAAVQLAVWTGEQLVIWVFSRDLLARGLFKPTAPPAGDIRMRPSPVNDTRLEVWLSSPAGRCVLLMNRAEVQKFVESTWWYLPPHKERIAVPDTPDELLRVIGDVS
jgi:hypothetical protein